MIKNFQGRKFAVGILISSALFFCASNAYASAISDVVYTPSGSVVGTFIAASATTTTFTPASTALGTGSTTVLTFPTGTTLTNYVIAASDFRIRQASNGAASCVNGVETAPSAIATTSSTITLTIAAASLSNSCTAAVNNGKGQVTIKLSSTAGGNEIKHPTAITTTGTFTVDLLNDTGSQSNVTFVSDTATDVRVETAANGSGVVVPAQNLSPGSSLTVYAITRDQYSNFVANVSADAWSLTNKTGGNIRDADLVSNGTSATFLPIFAGGSAKIQATSGALTTTSSGIITIPSSGGSGTFDYWGCMNSAASNFNSLANKDDGSCNLPAGVGSTTTTGDTTTSINTQSTVPPMAPPTADNQGIGMQMSVAAQGRGSTNSTVSMHSNMDFVRDLKLGAVGDDVKALQVFLNTHGYMIASTGAGSSGHETKTFGKLTRDALAKFQTANGIKPASGYFGPKTRALLQTLP